LAAVVVFAVEHHLPEHLYNMGTGVDLTIKELAEMVQGIVGHQGEIIWDTSKPDGTPRKLMDISKMKEIGCVPSITLVDGIAITYEWFIKNEKSIKEVII
jgi:GDP-L-fucose synthase